MIKFLRKLWSDRRGNALMIAGLSLPLIVGAAGLGTDTVQWVVWKRELQRAADSAALAGVYALAQETGVTDTQAVNADLNQNNHTMVDLLAGYPQVDNPAGPGWMSPVRVRLAIKKDLGFSGMFLSDSPTIEAVATAALIEDGTYCVVALSETGSAIQIGGSTNVNMGCGAISNSLDATDAVGVNGTAHTFIADPVSSVGGTSATINGADDVRSFQLPMEDPYEDLPTSVPAGENCTNFNHASKTNPDGSKKPGCYNQFNPGNGTITLSPGTYYLNNTSLNLNGQTRIVGEGVTIILTGNNPGTLTMNGNSSLDITAPTSGTYANMAIIQSANATTGNNNTINGDNGTSIDGAVYFPRGDVSFSGSTGQAFQCAMIVGYTVEFTGSSTIQNDTSSCTADTQVTHKRVRLVA